MFNGGLAGVVFAAARLSETAPMNQPPLPDSPDRSPSLVPTCQAAARLKQPQAKLSELLTSAADAIRPSGEMWCHFVLKNKIKYWNIFT